MTIEEHLKEVARQCFTSAACTVQEIENGNYRVGVFHNGPSPEMAVMHLVMARAAAVGMSVKEYLDTMCELCEGEEKCEDQSLFF